MFFLVEQKKGRKTKVFSQSCRQPLKVEAGMTNRHRRQEHSPRYGLTQQCRGHGLHTANGSRVEFRGVDVSHHGLGCVMVGNFQNRDTLILDIGGSKFHLR
jgi:hypothetical protein